VRQAVAASQVSLAGDLSRYGSAAVWKGAYYRGEKIGFTVSQVTPRDDGYELQEDGRLQMMLLGATSAARLSTTARVDKAFALQSFSFSLDPGTGPIQIRGTLDGKRLLLTIKTPPGERTETRDLPEAPRLALNLSRQLAASGLEPGQVRELMVFDPATLRNSPMRIEVEQREVVRAAGRPVPAFKVRSSFSGITGTSWITDTGEVVREESPTGLLVVRETQEKATAMAVSGELRADILEAAAIVPTNAARNKIDDARAVERLRVRIEGVELAGKPDLDGVGQRAQGDELEVRDLQRVKPTGRDPEASRFLTPEPFLESDDPEIVAEAQRALQGIATPRLRAERLVRHVNALLEKKPTVSLPSAREVLRTRVGDCNEHTALYVALARAAGLPARIAVGLVHVHGAFYYHAWAEVYVEEEGGGQWLPVDPTLNQFPADATHLRLARGGLEQQAQILSYLGRARLTITELVFRSGYDPVLVGRPSQDLRPLEIELPRRDGRGRSCWSFLRRN
jgi:hypothetical protein